MTKEEIRMIGIFVAGRVAAKEQELGVSDITQETTEQKNTRMLNATSEFLRWMYDVNPSMLPKESREMVEAAKMDVLMRDRKNFN
jgi:hypothetical protein